MKEIIKAYRIDGIICDGIHLAANIPSDQVCHKVLAEQNIESSIIKQMSNTFSNLLYKYLAHMEWSKLSAYEHLIWPKFDEIHVCSPVDKKKIEERVNHKQVVVIPNGVDTEFFQPMPAISRKPASIVFTGLIGWKPNEDAVLFFVREIFPLIKQEVQNVEFSIVGKDPSPKITKLAGVDKAITVTGLVDDVRPFIAK